MSLENLLRQPDFRRRGACNVFYVCSSPIYESTSTSLLFETQDSFQKRLFAGRPARIVVTRRMPEPFYRWHRRLWTTRFRA